MRAISSVMLSGLVVLISACDRSCDSSSQVLWGSVCRSLDLTYSRTHTTTSATSAVGIPNARKVELSCAASANAGGFCQSISDGSGYFIVFVPDDGTGNFTDSNLGTINNCDLLWYDMINASPGPADIAGVFFSNSDLGEKVACTDESGCTGSSVAYVAGWDATNLTATTTPISIAPDAKFLSCAFIATNLSTPPPQYGMAANSHAWAWGSVTVADPILFDSWTEY